MSQKQIVADNIKKFFDNDLNRIKEEINDMIKQYEDYDYVDKSNLIKIKDLLN